MERPAHGPRAHEFAARDGLLHARLRRASRPQAYRPQSAEVVLSLHGAEPPDDCGGIVEDRAGEVLIR